MVLRKLASTVLVLIFSIALSLVALEVGIRVFHPQRTFAVTVNAWDKDLGTRQIPGARGFVVCRDYAIDLIINAKGLRDRDYPYHKPEGTRRILCLGDSYACGYGVQAEDTFAKALERLLNAGEGLAVRWEVINAGVGSTGTAHQLAYFVREGYEYESEFVVLCFCQANDFVDNAMCGLYSLEGDELVKHDAPLTESRRVQRITRWVPGYNTLFAKSHLLNLIKYKVASLHYARLMQEADESASGLPARNDEGQLNLTKHLLLALRDECRARGCELVLMVVPLPRCEDPLPEAARLVEFARDRGILCVDLLPRFREQAGSGVQNYYPHDRHWNRNGHELAAEILYDFLDSRCLHSRFPAAAW